MKNSLFVKIILGIIAILLIGSVIFFVLKNNQEVQNYKEYDVPKEKEVAKIVVEGMEEEVDYSGVESSLGYTIQYDKDSFKLTRENGKDYYRVASNGVEGMGDEVYFSIEYVKDSYEELKTKNAENEYTEIEINGRKGFMVEFIDGVLGSKNDHITMTSDVETLWYIEVEKGTYIVDEHFFMEAAEGWGVRMDQMIATLEINK